jgi:hypothetical protein
LRIDRSDPADQPDGARIDCRARPTPDDPNAAGKDQGKTVEGDGRPNSSPGPLDSGLRTERAATYRAAVDVAYRQHAIDHGNAQATKPERETVTLATRRIEAEDPRYDGVSLENRLKDRDRPTGATELVHLQVPDRTTAAPTVLVHNTEGPGYPTIGAAADAVQTGARGPASGREFDPEAAGGPIQQLDAGKARITNEGVQEVAAHLQRFTGGGSLQAPEQGMLDRLTSIAAGDIEPTSYDLNFFTHELDEASRYAKLGFGPGSGVNLGSADMYEVWNDVHTATLEDYGISDADLFHPGLAP